MKKFILTVDVDITVEVPIEAETEEEAIQKAKNGDYEITSLNDGTIYDERLSRLWDTYYNEIKNFNEE